MGKRFSLWEQGRQSHARQASAPTALSTSCWQSGVSRKNWGSVRPSQHTSTWPSLVCRKAWAEQGAERN